MAHRLVPLCTLKSTFLVCILKSIENHRLSPRSHPFTLSAWCPTWGSRDVHLLEILALKNSNCQLSRGWHIAEREANIPQVLETQCTLYTSTLSHLIVHFDWLDVLPLLDGLGQVDHAQGHLHLSDLVVLGKSVIVKYGEDQRLVESLAIWKLERVCYYHRARCLWQTTYLPVWRKMFH